MLDELLTGAFTPQPHRKSKSSVTHKLLLPFAVASGEAKVVPRVELTTPTTEQESLAARHVFILIHSLSFQSSNVWYFFNLVKLTQERSYEFLVSPDSYDEVEE